MRPNAQHSSHDRAVGGNDQHGAPPTARDLVARTQENPVVLPHDHVKHLVTPRSDEQHQPRLLWPRLHKNVLGRRLGSVFTDHRRPAGPELVVRLVLQKMAQEPGRATAVSIEVVAAWNAVRRAQGDFGLRSHLPRVRVGMQL